MDKLPKDVRLNVILLSFFPSRQRESRFLRHPARQEAKQAKIEADSRLQQEQAQQLARGKEAEAGKALSELNSVKQQNAEAERS